jgi:hypothetical protein
MTSVRLALAAPTSTGTIRRPSGSVEWRPTKRRDVAGDVVLPAPFTVGLADTPPVIDVDPTEPGWAWQVVERVQGGSPKARYLSVPDVATVVDYADLVEVDGSTLDPVTLSNAWWAEVTAYAQPAGDYATNAALSTGLAGKVNSSTYTAGLAGKQDKATLGADVAADATVRAAFVSPSAIALIPLANYLAPGQAMPNDGVTDAAPLINTAMNDLLVKANGPQPFGPICYVLDLGPGRFRINSTIQPGGTAPTTQNQHVGITGAGRNQTFLLPYGAITAIAFNQINDTLPAAIDCHFSDFTIDLKNATLGPAGASRKGFIGRGWFDCTFTRLRVRNSPATAYGVDFPVRCTFTACSAVTTSTGVNGTLDMSAGPIAAAQFFSGFGLGFGVFDNESVTFDGCEATDCYRGGFFFEAFEASAGNTKRTAVIKMVGCRSWNNRIGVCNVGASGVSATNCEITDNTVAGYYGGVSGGTTVIASLATTLDNCQILRNGYGVYSTGDFTGVGHNYTALRDVLGGYRLLNNRIEDNVSGGIVVERFNGIEAGGLTVRGNHIRRNGGAGMVLRQAVGPVRDLSIEDNYFDANTGTALSLLIALNAPKITGNTFCNPVGGSAQALGVEWHPAEPGPGHATAPAGGRGRGPSSPSFVGRLWVTSLPLLTQLSTLTPVSQVNGITARQRLARRTQGWFHSPSHPAHLTCAFSGTRGLWQSLWVGGGAGVFARVAPCGPDGVVRVGREVGVGSIRCVSACPRICMICRSGTPACTSHDAQVCRMTYGRTGSMPAASSAGRHTRAAKSLSTSSRPPRGAGNSGPDARSARIGHSRSATSGGNGTERTERSDFG